jgi:hypothetical protein
LLTAPNGDYNGLNVTITAASDPVFTVNPEWAAESPEIAEQVIIRRTFVPGPADVDIEIRPLSTGPNVVMPTSHMVLPVAILATGGTVNGGHIDPKTVRFGPAGAEPIRGSLLRDVDLDGVEDLLLSFDIKDAGIPCGTTRASIVAQTFDGLSVTGSDEIETIGCRPWCVLIETNKYSSWRTRLRLPLSAAMMRRVPISDDDLELAERACRSLAATYRRGAEGQSNPSVRQLALDSAGKSERMAERMKRARSVG